MYPKETDPDTETTPVDFITQRGDDGDEGDYPEHDDFGGESGP